MRPGIDVRYHFKCDCGPVLNNHRQNNPDKRSRCPKCGAGLLCREKVCAWCKRVWYPDNRHLMSQCCSDECHELKRWQYRLIAGDVSPPDPIDYVFAPWEKHQGGNPFYARPI